MSLLINCRSIVLVCVSLILILLVASPLSVVAQALESTDASERLNELLSSPGLMTTVPKTDQYSKLDRAQLFYEIGGCYFALGDTVRAARALRYAYALDPALAEAKPSTKEREGAQAQQFVADLSLSAKRHRYAQTTKLKAAGRSLIFPGWGQMYRGHRKRGVVLTAVTATAGLFLAKAVRDYDNAKKAYEETKVAELGLTSLTGTSNIPRPFESSYNAYQSRTNTANAAAILLAAVWGASVLDNLILEPNRFELRLRIGP